MKGFLIRYENVVFTKDKYLVIIYNIFKYFFLPEPSFNLSGHPKALKSNFYKHYRHDRTHIFFREVELSPPCILESGIRFYQWLPQIAMMSDFERRFERKWLILAIVKWIRTPRNVKNVNKKRICENSRNWCLDIYVEIYIYSLLCLPNWKFVVKYGTTGLL